MEKRIRQIRKDQGLNQIEFAKKINRSRSAVLTWEGGNAEPDAASFALICNVFDVNPDWLKTGYGEMYIERLTNTEWVERIMSGKNEFAKNLFVQFAKLGDEEWEMLRHIVEKLSGKGEG